MNRSSLVGAVLAAAPSVWAGLGRDGRLLFAARAVRMFAYGFLSVVFVLYLALIGLTGAQIGLLLSLTLAGDTAISLGLAARADRWGRRRTLLAGSGLMALASAAFVSSRSLAVLLPAAVFGVLSPTGYEVGPFLLVEQASLSQVAPAERRTSTFAWYNLIGALATALGALAGGALAQAAQTAGLDPAQSYRLILVGYGLAGLILAGIYHRLSRVVEALPSNAEPEPAGVSLPAPTNLCTNREIDLLGLGPSRGIVFRLALLFALDAFGGGFVIQSVLAYWFHVRFGAEPGTLGAIFFGANLLAGFSALAAARLAARIGLVRTMVFTHLPSNLLLMLVPLAPAMPLAAAILLLRYSISQMDVPARQSYTMAVVRAEERSAAAGVTGVARTLGAALASAFLAPFLARPALLGAVFFLAGGLKSAYDLALYRGFRRLRPPEETA